MATRTQSDLDYELAVSGAGLVEHSGRGQIDVSGADAEEFLQGQVTNDVEELAPGEGCYAALLDPKARILGDARVLRIAEGELWLDTEPAALEPVLELLRTYRIGRQVEITDRSNERGLISLFGARVPGIVADTFGVDGGSVPVTENSFLKTDDVLLVRTFHGVDVIAPAASTSEVAERLLAAGASRIDEATAELLRIESGRPRFGVDVTETNLPGEAGIVERAVSFTKGCYVGQEPVARMFHKGHPNRLLRGLQLSAPAATGAALRLGEREVGTLSSVAISPRLGPIGLAIVRREAEPGSELALEGSEISATVVELPFPG